MSFACGEVKKEGKMGFSIELYVQPGAQQILKYILQTNNVHSPTPKFHFTKMNMCQCRQFQRTFLGVCLLLERSINVLDLKVFKAFTLFDSARFESWQFVLLVAEI